MTYVRRYQQKIIHTATMGAVVVGIDKDGMIYKAITIEMSKPPRTWQAGQRSYDKCDGSNQPPMTARGECQVCGRVFKMSISGYVPRHNRPKEKK